jgi:hypothetical protein
MVTLILLAVVALIVIVVAGRWPYTGAQASNGYDADASIRLSFGGLSRSCSTSPSAGPAS